MLPYNLSIKKNCRIFDWVLDRAGHASRQFFLYSVEMLI